MGRFFLLFLFLAKSLTASSLGFVDLEELASDLGLDVRKESLEDSSGILIEGAGVRLEFSANSRIVELNGIRVFMGDPVVRNDQRLFLSVEDWERTLRPILQPQLYPNPPPCRRIFLDAGHGGRDPGALNRSVGIQEKDLALDLVLRVGRRLQAKGFEVFYTRSTDRFIPLEERPRQSNRVGADLFLSLHFNAARSEVRGVETFVYTLEGDPSTGRTRIDAEDRMSYPGNRNDPWNSLLGYYLQRELIRSSQEPDRGLKRARFTVLETLTSPGALVEFGFLTNPVTAARLKDPGFRDQLADAVVRGVVSYRRTMNRLRRGE